MSSRMRNIAAENEDIAAAGGYGLPDGTSVSVRGMLAAAADGTRCHQPDEQLAPVRSAVGRPLEVEVTAEGSLQAARRLCDSGPGDVAVLNFASARNAGGGYLRGAKAQEEDLCRQSLLYSCLVRAPEYYAAHRASDDLHYSDRVIWSPRVPVHRGDDEALLAEPYPVSFLTSPAPNATQLLRRDPDAGPGIQAALHRRAGRVLTVAAHHGVRRLVLGAWGCGVFGNNPATVAQAFHQHLYAEDGDLHGAFDQVVFAVWDRADPSANRDAFTRRFAA
ncbi:TIGR02452 family protein [Streptacidiphilus sp. N1-12]|uniref:TIGR02452 family protein n=2 Tax=Streptacidiphilus alkalitolerans TaxID=3342712 RepID=A0ABV6WHZ7_9ACTN